MVLMVLNKQNSYFPININEKLACVLYTSAYYTGDFTVHENSE